MKYFILSLFCLFLLACSDSKDAALRALVSRELSAHPEADARDIYKLLYQGEFGVGHLIASPKEAASYLDEEIASMPRFGGEPLTEPCAADGSMIRVNLRPFVEKKLTPSRLVDAMMETVASVHGDPARFEALWNRVRTLIAAGELPLDLPDFDSFTVEIRSRHYPYAHHSDRYGNRYKPAYRVVLRSAFSKNFPEE